MSDYEHIVKEDETIYDIALFYYGREDLGKQLSQTNGYKSPDDVKIGDSIKFSFLWNDS